MFVWMVKNYFARQLRKHDRINGELKHSGSHYLRNANIITTVIKQWPRNLVTEC